MVRLIEQLGADAVQATRQLVRAPGLAMLAVAALALGIGAVTTVFALLNALMFQPLPVAQPERLVMLSDPSFSYPQYKQVRSRGAAIFDGMFAHEQRQLNVRWQESGGVETTSTLLVTGDFHTTLGVRPVLGRALLPMDDGASPVDASSVAVLSHAAWQRRFGGDTTVIGRVIHVENTAIAIVGVAPRGFFGMAVGTAPELTMPLTLLPRLRPDSRGILDEAGRAWVHIAGRLGSGLTVEQANAAFRAIWPQVLDATIGSDETPERRARHLSRRSELVPATYGFSSVRNQYRQPLWVLFGLVGVLLLATCATVANLSLVRVTFRRRELAVRLALGATATRIFRQLLTEGLLLSTAGAVLGVLLAAWATDMLINLLSTREEAIMLARVIDFHVIGFVALAAMVTAVLFTLLPAFRTTLVDYGTTLRETARQVGGSRARVGKALVATQLALAMLLVTGAALFTRSLSHLLTLDPGFDRQNVAVIGLDALSSPSIASPNDTVGNVTRLTDYYAMTLDRARALPGVRAAALVWIPPISGDDYWNTRTVAIDGGDPIEDQDRTFFNAISPEYLTTMGTTLLRGRDFQWSDRTGAPRVVIVNESCARAFFGTADPIGHRISVGLNPSRQDLEIIGVVRDAKYQRLQEPNRRVAYLPYLQLPEFTEGNNLSLVLRTQQPATEVANDVLPIISALDPLVPVRFETLHDRIRNTLTIERSLAAIAGFLGLLSLIIAFGALYGLMSHLVAHRRHEIGIRIALGAPQGTIERMIVRETVGLALAGIVAGLMLAYNGTRVIIGFLHGIEPADPVAVIGASALLTLLALVAGYVPARRAARTNPIVTLQSD